MKRIVWLIISCICLSGCQQLEIANQDIKKKQASDSVLCKYRIVLQTRSIMVKGGSAVAIMDNLSTGERIRVDGDFGNDGDIILVPKGSVENNRLPFTN
jgi:hypothetical protein